MSKFFNRLSQYFSKYLDSRIIFALDFILSFMSSLAILVLLTGITRRGSITTAFAIWWMTSSIVATLIVMLTFKNYKTVIRHTKLRDLVGFMLESFVKMILMLVIMWIGFKINSVVIVALFIDFLLTMVVLVSIRLVMVVVYDHVKDRVKEQGNVNRVLVFGTSEKSVAAITRFQNSYQYHIVGFLVKGKEPHLKVNELPVYSYLDFTELKELVGNLNIRCILFPTETSVREESDGLVAFCNKNNLKALIIPSVDEVVDGKIMNTKIREVKIEDLLGRQEIKLEMDAIIANFKGKTVMVTGAAGSIGSELCRQLAGFGVKQLILFDNGETPMHNIRLELEERYPDLKFVPVIGDVRQIQRLDYAFRTWHPQVVFHAAAYKHVPLMEENPCEAVLVNVFGSRNVADKCIEYGTEMMVMISTDKAVNPTNIMGCTKRLAEIYVQSLGLAIANGSYKPALREGVTECKTKFVTTRFGNVLGSNGSVIPRFRHQIEYGGPVTVTDPRITRFFMTIPEACRLVMEAATMSSGNQIFVFDMGESVKIDTLARRMISLAGLEVDRDIKIEYSGLRPGEKLYEEVLSNKENTEPTSHDRIRIAKVREYDYNHALQVVNQLEELSRSVRIPEMVKLMKETVPEFISMNSEFSKYDKPAEDKESLNP